MRDHAGHPARDTQFFSHSEGCFVLPPSGKVCAGAYPPSPASIGVKIRGGAYEVPPIRTFRRRAKSQLDIKRLPVCNGAFPRGSAATSIVYDDLFLLIPASLIVKGLIEPSLVDVGNLTVIVRCPN